MLPSNRLQRCMLWCLALSLVLAQALGVAHRAVHLDLRIIGHEHAHHAHDEHDCVSHGILSALFAGHESGDESCRLLDASFGMDTLYDALAPVNIAPLAIYLIAFAQADLAALRSWQAQARAPPL